MEIGVSGAKKRLATLLHRVQTGQRFVITRQGRPAAELIPFKLQDVDTVRKAIDGLKAFQETHLLEGLPVRRMIEEGRRH